MNKTFLLTIVFSVIILNKSYTKQELCKISKTYNVTIKSECYKDNYNNEDIPFERKTNLNSKGGHIFNSKGKRIECKSNFDKCNNISANRNENIPIENNTDVLLPINHSMSSEKNNKSESEESSESMYKEYTLQEIKNMAKENVRVPSYVDEEPPLNSSEKVIMKEVLAKAEELVEELLDSGESMFYIFKKVPKNGGNSIVQDFLQYNRNLNKLLKMAKANKRYTNEAVADYLETNQPYPYIPKTEYCKEKIKQDFNWTDVDFNSFDKIYNNTNQLYCELQEFHNSLPESEEVPDSDF